MKMKPERKARFVSQPEDFIYESGWDGDEPVKRRAADADLEARAVGTRLRLRSTFRPLLASAVGRVVEREVAAIREHVHAQLGRRTTEDFLGWLEHYEQNEVRPLVERELAPTLAAYAGAVESEVLRELDIPALSEQQDPFLAAYALDLSAIYADRSNGQIRALARKAQASGASVAALIEARLVEWLMTRAGRIADVESVRAGEAAAHNTYKRAGVRRLTWRETPGRHCAYCNRLDGRTVGTQETFIAAGTELPGNEGDPPMKIRGPKLHPPAHRTCRCMLRPE